MRAVRTAAGLTQSELASRSGVSRQMVGAIEAGRHLPRIDAAVALAEVLGVAVGELFGAPGVAVDVLTGAAPGQGAMVRSSSVGGRIVTAPVRDLPDGWEAADGLVAGDRLAPLGHLAEGMVVVGCEPGMVVLERILREGGMRAMAVAGSTRAGLLALRAGRAHAAVVHWPVSEPAPDTLGTAVARFHIARWRVGIAAASDAPGDWWREALAGTVPVVQREPGAGVQATFESAAGVGAGPRPGPRVAGHLEAVRVGIAIGAAAVTIEPVAVAVGARFHPLDRHRTELWVDRRRLGDRAVIEALAVLSTGRFRRHLEGIGGYEVERCGEVAG